MPLVLIRIDGCYNKIGYYTNSYNIQIIYFLQILQFKFYDFIILYFFLCKNIQIKNKENSNCLK